MKSEGYELSLGVKSGKGLLTSGLRDGSAYVPEAGCAQGGGSLSAFSVVSWFNPRNTPAPMGELGRCRAWQQSKCTLKKLDTETLHIA